jgi:RNA polymerase sigma factor (sigma-70 family)
MRDDADLLRHYAHERSQEAFGELVRRHIDLVYSAALPRVGRDTHLAEDVVQTVFTDLARKAPTLALHGPLAGWLYTSARFAASDVVRRERRRREREQAAHVMNEPGRTDAPNAADWEELRPVLERAIDNLKPAYRDAVLLRFFGQRRFAEIAALLSLTEEAAQKRVERALDQLRSLLARQGITSATAAMAFRLAEQSAIAAPAGLAAKVSGAALASLTAGGSGAAAAVTLLEFMTATKLSVGLAAVVSVLAIGYGVIQRNLANNADLAVKSASAARATWDAQRREFARRAEQVEAANLATTKQIEEQRNQAATRSSAPSPAASTPSPAVTTDPKAVMRANLPLATIATRAGLRLRFDAFYRSLNLNSAQIEQLELFMTHGDTINGFVKSDANTPEEIARRNEARVELRELEAKIRAMIGEDGMRKFQDYQWTADLRANVVNAVARSVYYTDAPLTGAQGDKLVAVLIDASSWPERRGRVDVASVKWDDVMPKAATFLSQPQLAALDAQRLKAEFDRAYQKLTGLPNAPRRLPGS